jgi:hypothetical protein
VTGIESKHRESMIRQMEGEVVTDPDLIDYDSLPVF